MTTKYFADDQGRYLGAIAGFQPPDHLERLANGTERWVTPPVQWPPAPVGGIEVPAGPSDAAELWDAELQQWAMPVRDDALRVITKIEQDNPITHRSLRELILTIGQAFPAGQQTVFYQRVLAVELAIRAERDRMNAPPQTPEVPE